MRHPVPHPSCGSARIAADGATHGLWYGAVGVLIFALSIPMTRLATVGNAGQVLPAEFVAIGRAALAGVLAAAYLGLVRARRPRRDEWPALALTAAGVVFGWPLLLGWAVLHVDAVHASVVAGMLPLATSAIAAVWLRQRPGTGFWACALAGTALVALYAAWRGGGALHRADVLLLLAVLCASFGYVAGARLSRDMPPQQVISWVLVVALPLTLPITWLTRPTAPASAIAWGAFVYVALFSMWLGFFFWYRGLSLGGALRVSQLQLLQPFASMLLAVPLLGERLDAATVVFALAVLATVAIGKSMPVRSRATGAANTAAAPR